MHPMFRWKIIKRQQRRSIFRQACRDRRIPRQRHRVVQRKKRRLIGVASPSRSVTVTCPPSQMHVLPVRCFCRLFLPQCVHDIFQSRPYILTTPTASGQSHSVAMVPSGFRRCRTWIGPNGEGIVPCAQSRSPKWALIETVFIPGSRG